MSKGKPFNGHPSWNAWNVSLWINNDELLYWRAQGYIAEAKGRRHAAELFVADRLETDNPKTPDGAPWTITNVMRAMRGMK